MQQAHIGSFDEKSISVCIPATASDLHTSTLPRLLKSIRLQTLQPKEVVVVFSQLHDSACNSTASYIRSLEPALNMVIRCTQRKQNQAWARNFAAEIASSTTLSFIDSDDVLAPQNLRRVADMFTKFDTVITLHSCAGSEREHCSFSHDDFMCASNASSINCKASSSGVVLGNAIYDQASRTMFVRDHIYSGIHNSQLSVRTYAMRGSDAVLFRTSSACYRKEDSIFARDILTQYGRRDSTASILWEPLSWYIPRSIAQKAESATIHEAVDIVKESDDVHLRVAILYASWFNVSVVRKGANILNNVVKPLGADVLLALSYQDNDQCASPAACRKHAFEKLNRLEESIAVLDMVRQPTPDDLKRAATMAPSWIQLATRFSKVFGCKYEGSINSSIPVCSNLPEDGNSFLAPIVGGKKYHVLQEFWMQARALSLLTSREREMGFRYQRVIWSRLEMVWHHPHPPLHVLDPNCVWIPGGEDFGGINDRHAVLSREHAQIYLSRWQTIFTVNARGMLNADLRPCLAKRYYVCFSERLLAIMLRRASIPVCRMAPFAHLGCSRKAITHFTTHCERFADIASRSASKNKIWFDAVRRVQDPLSHCYQGRSCQQVQLPWARHAHVTGKYPAEMVNALTHAHAARHPSARWIFSDMLPAARFKQYTTTSSSFPVLGRYSSNIADFFSLQRDRPNFTSLGHKLLLRHSLDGSAITKSDFYRELRIAVPPIVREELKRWGNVIVANSTVDGSSDLDYLRGHGILQLITFTQAVMPRCDPTNVRSGEWKRVDSPSSVLACPFLQSWEHCQEGADLIALTHFVPRSCKLDSFSAAHVLSQLQGRKLHFIGDHVQSQFFASFVCHLIAGEKEYQGRDRSDFGCVHFPKYSASVCLCTITSVRVDTHGSTVHSCFKRLHMEKTDIMLYGSVGKLNTETTMGETQSSLALLEAETLVAFASRVLIIFRESTAHQACLSDLNVSLRNRIASAALGSAGIPILRVWESSQDTLLAQATNHFGGQYSCRVECLPSALDHWSNLLANFLTSPSYLNRDEHHLPNDAGRVNEVQLSESPLQLQEADRRRLEKLISTFNISLAQSRQQKKLSVRVVNYQTLAASQQVAQTPGNSECTSSTQVNAGRWEPRTKDRNTSAYGFYPACPFMRPWESCATRSEARAAYVASLEFIPDSGCIVPSFDAAQVLQIMSGRVLLFVGDSVHIQFFASFACHFYEQVSQQIMMRNTLQWLSPENIRKRCNGARKCHYESGCIFFKNDFKLCVCGLFSAMPKLHRPLFHKCIKDMRTENRDVVVYGSVGLHHTGETVTHQDEIHVQTMAEKEAQMVLEYMRRLPSAPRIIYREVTAQHFSSPGGHFVHSWMTDYNRPNASATCASGLDASEMRKYHQWNKFANPIFERAGVPILRVWESTSLAWNAHVGHGDCTHFCLPGIPDLWSALLADWILAANLSGLDTQRERAKEKLNATSRQASFCPKELYKSAPSSHAPLPHLLGYRRSFSTGSWTDKHIGYVAFALAASQNASMFATFRQVYYHRRFAGIECDPAVCWNSLRHADEVVSNLRKVARDDLLLRAIPIISDLDAIGSSYVWPLSDPEFKDCRVSGLTMRYLGKVADLERLYGSLDAMHLIEIGVGFGGFAALLLRLHTGIASYTLVDLPEVLNIAERYLRAAGVIKPVLFLNAAPCSSTNLKAGDFSYRPGGYDLVISMYAYAELPINVRLAYFDSLISNSKRGFISDHGKRLTINDAARQELLPSRVQAEIAELKLAQRKASLHYNRADKNALVKSLLLPAMLIQRENESTNISKAQGRNHPNISHMIIIKDLMGGWTPHGLGEAQVAWGVNNDYFPVMINQMRQQQQRQSSSYPMRKLTLSAQLTCPSRDGSYVKCLNEH